jgi:hypothetical protein
MKKFEEWEGQEPKDQDHYLLKTLKRSERWTIKFVYRSRWQKIVRNKGLSNNQCKYFELYFKEIHVRHYLTVVSGGPYVTGARLIRNFFTSKANENLRAVLGALRPYNLTVFVQGIRSQIELNALLNKFIKDPAYHKQHLLLNEDRRRAKEVPTTININTLVDGLSSEVIPYQELYHELSLLLHPNPSAIMFYAQAERDPSPDAPPIGRPNLSFYFTETISDTKNTEKWFSGEVWSFLTCVEHFLILFDMLKNEFHLNEKEREEHLNFSMAAIVGRHQKEILSALNKAERQNMDKQEAINEVFRHILKKDGGDDKV